MSYHSTSYLMLKLLNTILFAAYFFYVGLRGLLLRKPFLIPTSWLYVLILVIFIPGLVPLIFSGPSLGAGTTTLLVLPMVFLVLTFYFWKVFSGYSVFGVTDQSFRKSLVSSLEKLNLSYTEDMNGFHLKSRDVTLKPTLVMGTGQLRISGAGNRDLIREIAAILKKEFEKSNVEFSPKIFYFYLGLGTMFLIISFVEFSMYQKILNF